MIICIERESGSKGREIGVALAKKLNMPFYDSNLLQEIIKSRKLAGYEISAIENKVRHSGELTVDNMIESELSKLNANDVLFRVHKKVILKLADREPGVFVGRCADCVLKEAGKPRLSVFISAPMEKRLENKMSQGMDEAKALKLITDTDRQRRAYYNYYTGTEWGAPQNYDICINSGSFNLEKIISILEEAAK
ncbi:MAG: AAA family ATPase [Clostridia bacterium]